MALFVYMTDECQKDVREHSYNRPIEKFRNRILADQRTTLFDNFPPPYLKKRFEKQFRLIASERYFGEHVVVCFYRLLVRSSRTYERFCKDARGYGDEYFRPLADDAVLTSWLEEQLVSGETHTLPDPDENEKSYLWEVFAESNRAGTDIIVCESQDWVNAIQQKWFSYRFKSINDKILELCDHGEIFTTFEIPCSNEITLIARYFPRLKIAFLMFPANKSNAELKSEILEKYRPFLQEDISGIDKEAILKYSARAYPCELLLDEDMWMDAQTNKAANLALSPEEADILKSVHKTQEKEVKTGFPLFINGRAGSGKSTILQYLFADYLYNYLSRDPQTIEQSNGPLYLTCSRDLLNISERVVKSLLECSYNFLERKNITAPGGRRIDPADIDPCFQVFHDFLQEKVPEAIRQVRFRRENKVDFARFKKLWQEKFSRDRKAIVKYPPDLSWHVIRTYIKGISIDDYLEIDEYQELPRNEITVKMSSFREIYEKVWSAWYRPLGEVKHFWDDQDLARYLLQNELIQPEFPAIFADEAQDFTRIELELLLRLSLFSDRALSPQDLNRVPFAFAGDPFQTLNPTGFRWDAIKSSFVVKFIHSLDPARQSQVSELNFHELTYNYRSSRSIVKLCNSIQAMRSVVFSIANLQPQRSWQFEKNPPDPVWFDRGTPELFDLLKKNADVVIIVPCEEGEEIDYVDQDDFLKSIIKTDETGVPQNVLSSSRAKGLEFNRVVLYGFSARCPASLKGFIENKDIIDDLDSKLSDEYFMNRLYVGASRAKRRLFIIDSREGIEQFWRFTTDATFLEDIVAKIDDDRQLWRENVGQLQRGVREHWSEDREDMAHIAERFEQEGRAKNDPYLLRSAAMAYSQKNNDHKAKECRAMALWLEEKYLESGKLYIEIEQYRQAMAVFWEGGQDGPLWELVDQHSPDLKSSNEARFAHFFYKDGSIDNADHVLRDFAASLQSGTYIIDKAGTEESWTRALRRVLNRLIREIHEIAEIDDKDLARLQGLERNFQILLNRGFALDLAKMAELSYHIGDYDRAVTLWEQSDQSNSPLLALARARKLIAALKQNSLLRLSPEENTLLSNYFREEKDYPNAARYLFRAGDLRAFPLLLKDIVSSGDQQIFLQAVNYYLTLLIQQGRWQEILMFIRQSRLRHCDNSVNRLVADTINHNKWHYYLSMILEISQSDTLPRESGSKVQQQVSDFLKENLIANGFDWAQLLSPEIAGAAIERSGRDIDALLFYENVISGKLFTENQQRHAQIRWVYMKRKQSNREESRGMAGAAEKHRREAEEKRSEYLINEEELQEEYPNVRTAYRQMKSKYGDGGYLVEALPAFREALQEQSATRTAEVPEATARAKEKRGVKESRPDRSRAPAAEPQPPVPLTPKALPENNGHQTPVAEKIICKVADYLVEYSRSKSRMVISRDMIHLVVLPVEQVVKSIDLEVAVQDGRYHCADWQLTVVFNEADADFGLYFGESGVRLVFQE